MRVHILTIFTPYNEKIKGCEVGIKIGSTAILQTVAVEPFLFNPYTPFSQYLLGYKFSMLSLA